MRALADAPRLYRFLQALSREADADASVYLTGGATAVLLGWLVLGESMTLAKAAGVGLVVSGILLLTYSH